FTDRVMFAVRDVTGRILGFGGRALSEDEPAKYINSPDTPVFKKGDTLYALHLARTAAGEAGRLVIVEGYTDVIAAHQAGVQYVVACLGTALTSDHLRLASRYAEEVVLAYDADAAGLKAALRDIGMFEACPAEVRIALLPEGHDPDTLIREQGPEAFERVVAAAVPAAEFRLRQTLAQYEGSEDTPAALAAAAEVLADVPDRTRRVELLDRVVDWCGRGDATRTDMLRRALWLEVGRKVQARRAQGNREAPPRRRGEDDRDVIVRTVAQCTGEISPGRVRLEKSLLAWAVSSEELAGRVFGELGPECFCAPGHGEIASALAEQVERGEFKPDELPAYVSDEMAQALLAELLLQDTPKPETEELTAAVQKLRVLHAAGLQALPWEHVLDGTDAEEEAPLPEGPAAELERLRREVVERLDRGEISPEDPLYQRYLRLVERVHGRGGVSFYEDRR
ncbi:MAG: toprim domain-containing protein, partial [Armatimonadetes bacterium]|nr:toprim domain-containing protein [Armatimonadota bacterium]